jgi:4-diphosphocytidyl-2-C-methyl-D-erythritol kinase
MRGIGERLSTPLHLPKLPAILVNPRVSTPTVAVFAARAANATSPSPLPQNDAAIALAERATSQANTPDAHALTNALLQSGNDLEAPAISLHPVIADVLGALRALPGCRLARMSGSGATCFGLFDAAHIKSAAHKLEVAHPDWWIAATTLG